MGIKMTIVLLLTFLIVQESVMSQGSVSSATENYTEDVLESIANNAEGTKDLSSLLENLDEYRTNPLNLNTATKEQLEGLFLLNDFQIAMLLDYRRKMKSIRSVYELQYIPGFRKQDVINLMPYVKCGKNSSGTNYDHPFKSVHQQFLLREQRVLEKQKGYQPLNDSILNANPYKSRYLGSPDKIFVRYQAKAGRRYEAGFVMEKDAGEEFFRGSDRDGFDFNSAYVRGTPQKGFVEAWMLGDYHVHLGQGLLCWSSYSPDIIPEISSINKRGEAIKGNLSAQENKFFRGAALETGKGHLRLLAFFSLKKLDATLTGPNSFSGFVETGIHATPLEIKKEHTVKQFTTGESVQYSSNRLYLGLNGIFYHFDKTLAPPEKLYTALSFRGNKNTGMSADFNYLAGRIQIFGETALSNHHPATLDGIIFYLNTDLNVSFIYRNYSPGYYSYYANAIGQSSGNEKGSLLQTYFRFSDFHIKSYINIFSVPWLRYRINVPSGGTDILFECDRTTDKSDIQFRYKYKQNETALTTAEPIDPFVTGIRQNFRLNARFSLNNWLGTQSRCELCLYHINTQHPEHGILFFQDLTVKQQNLPLQCDLRLAWFNAPDYDARLYAYEKDVLHAYTSQQFYGKGWRWMGLFKWKAMDKLSFWLKISQSVYPGKKAIGSGLTAIDNFHKTQIKLQAVLTLYCIVLFIRLI